MLHCTVNTAMLTTNVTLSCCCWGATTNISISSACLCRCATDTSIALLLALHDTVIITQVMTECQSWSCVLSGHVEHGDGTLSIFACDRESLSLSHSVTALPLAQVQDQIRESPTELPGPWCTVRSRACSEQCGPTSGLTIAVQSVDSHEYRTCPQHVGCSQSQSAILVETPLFAQNGMELPTFRSLILGFFCVANRRQLLREPFRRSRFSNPLSISWVIDLSSV